MSRARDNNPPSGIEATIASPSDPTLTPAAAKATLPLEFDSMAATVAQTGPDSPTHNERPPGAARPSQPAMRPPVRPSLKDNRYALGEEIARGGMGRVVDAMDTLLGRSVAIKEALTVDDDLRLRFLRETKITARLEHPSIVPVYDAGTMPDGSPFYVMRRVSGKPLEKLVFEAHTLDQRLGLLPNLLAAANAVAHAHGRGVIHRDIKPSNVLVGELGETVVIDWGLAKLLDDPDDVGRVSSPLPPSDEDNAVRTRIGSIVGTPGFMPPEQLLGERVDARSDVYALGATMYFLLSGRAPHAARTGDEMMNQALAGPPRPLRELVTGIPPELLTIVDKALAYDRRNRYLDAGGLAADLERFLKGQLVGSHRYSRRERLVRFWRRHRVAISVSVVAMVTLLVGGTLAITRVVDARRRASDALAEALSRNETLELGRARDTARTKPRRALELLRPLADHNWEAARSIALAARAKGVPRTFPNAGFVESLDLSKNGTRAISTGEDRVLREHDLASRTTREIAKLSGRASALYIDDDRQALVYGSGTIQLVDLAKGTIQPLFTGQLLTPQVQGRTLWWIEADTNRFRAWSRSLDENENRPAPIDDILWAVAPSPDAVAFAGEKALWLLRGGAVTTLAAGPAYAVTWIDDHSLAAVVQRHPVIIDIRDGSSRPISYSGDVRTISPAWKGTLVVRSTSSRISVLHPDVQLDLPPLNWTSTLLTRPQSPFVLAAIDGEMFLWDLRELLPTITTFGTGSKATYLDHGQLVIQHEDGASWVNLSTGKVQHPRVTGRNMNFAVDPAGRGFLNCDYERNATYFAVDRPDGVPLDGRCAWGAWASGRIVFGRAPDEVLTYDPSSNTTKLLFRGKAPDYSVVTAGDWVAGTLTDNSVWRHNAATGKTTFLPPQIDSRAIALQADGTAYLTEGSKVLPWNVDGTFGRAYELPTRINRLHWIDDTHLYVPTRGDAGYVLDLKTRAATLAFPSGLQLNGLTFESGAGTFVDEEGSLVLMTPLTGDAWTIGRPAKDPFWSGYVSADHTKVYTVAGEDLLTWELPFPRTREETLALIDSLMK